MANPGDTYWKALQDQARRYGPDLFESLMNQVGRNWTALREQSTRPDLTDQDQLGIRMATVSCTAALYGLCRISEHMWREQQKTESNGRKEST